MIAHLADIHLGKAQYGILQREEDLYQLFSEAINIAIQEHVDAIVISGDLFDKPRPPNKSIRELKKSLTPAIERNIPVLVVTGDHDSPKIKDANILQVLSLYLDNFHLLGLEKKDSSHAPKKYILEKGFQQTILYGVPFIPRYRERPKTLNYIFHMMEEDSKNHSGKKILIGHFPTTKFFSPYFDPGIELSDLPKSFHYYALGHLHQRITYTFNDGRKLAYPSSIDILDKTEIEDWKKNGKGFYLVDISKSEPDLQKIDLQVRPQYVFTGDINTILNHIKSMLQEKPERKPIVYVELKTNKKDKNLHENKILRLLENIALYTKIKPEIMEEEITIIQKRHLSEEEIIANYVKNKDLARVILELKECLSDKKNIEECNKIAEELAKKASDWEDIKRLSSPGHSSDLEEKRAQNTSRRLIDYF